MKNNSYVEENILWRKNQICLRDKYADTPAGFKSTRHKEEYINALKAELENYKKSQERILISSYIHYEKLTCIGRDQEIDKIDEILNREHCVFLCGIGGIGKSTIALEYISRNKDKYDCIIFAMANRGVADYICDDEGINITNLKYSKEEYKNIKRYYKEKIATLNEIAKTKRIIMVMDNYNVENDKELKNFMDLPFDKIVTTRINYRNIQDGQKIQIEAMSEEYWEKLIKYYSNGEATNVKINNVLKYAKKVGGHTLSIVLVTNQNANETIDRDNVKIISLLREFKLRKEEQIVLLYMAIMPAKGIDKQIFLMITGIKSEILDRLVELYLIDETQAWLKMHPLIAETVRNIMPPDARNCERLLRGVEEYMNGRLTGEITWERTYEENRKLEPYVMALYDTFSNPVAWLAKAYEEIATFLWIQHYFSEAEEYAIKIFNATYSYYGDTNELAGREALRVAAVYHNNLNHEKANEWYTKGYELLKKIKKRDFEADMQLIIACGKLARAARNEKRIETFYKYSNELEQIVFANLEQRKLNQMQREQLQMEYYYALLEKAKMYYEIDNIKEAKEEFSKIEMWLNANSNMGFRKVGFNDFKRALLIKEKDYEGAKTIAEENVEQTRIYRGKKYKDYIIYQETYADTLVLCSQKREAMRIYEKVLIGIQTYYKYENAWFNNIIIKMQKI